MADQNAISTPIFDELLGEMTAHDGDPCPSPRDPAPPDPAASDQATAQANQ